MITVLMATYNGQPYLEQQLDSILAQTVPVRILISDDGSNDGTREMLSRYRGWYPRQITLCHRAPGQPEAGSGAARTVPSASVPEVPPAARNFFWLMHRAFLEDKSDYILFSDQDDVWMNCKVKVLLRKMRAMERSLGQGTPILVHSDMEVVDKDLEEIAPSFFLYQHCGPARNTFAEVLAENPATGGAMMMNRALLRLVAGSLQGQPGGFQGQPAGSRELCLPSCCMHDWWVALAASCFGAIGCVPEPLSMYRQHGGNTLGARATGSVEDLRERFGRQAEVEANYRRMMGQAAAFLRCYGRRMDPEKRAVVQAYLSLPFRSPAARLRTVLRYGFCKSSRIQTLAMCAAMPGRGREEEVLP